MSSSLTPRPAGTRGSKGAGGERFPAENIRRECGFISPARYTLAAGIDQEIQRTRRATSCNSCLESSSDPFATRVVLAKASILFKTVESSASR